MGPSVAVSDLMVVAAEGGEVVEAGRSTLGPGGLVVEVAVDGGHSTAREDAGRVAGLDVAGLSDAGTPAGGAVVDHLAVLGDGESPFGLLVLLFCDLAGDVGDDRSVSGQFAGVL